MAPFVLLTALMWVLRRLHFGPGGADGEASDEELFARYAPALLALMRKQVRRDEDAQELVQQTFLQLHRARADFRPGSPLRPWLYTIALNLRREHFRRRARRPEDSRELTDREVPRSQQPDIGADETSKQVRAALARLPANQRLVIQLHWFDGLPFSECAAIVGASVSAVKVRAHRGYKRLKDLLSDLDTAGVTPPGPGA